MFISGRNAANPLEESWSETDCSQWLCVQTAYHETAKASPPSVCDSLFVESPAALVHRARCRCPQCSAAPSGPRPTGSRTWGDAAFCVPEFSPRRKFATFARASVHESIQKNQPRVLFQKLLRGCDFFRAWGEITV